MASAMALVVPQLEGRRGAPGSGAATSAAGGSTSATDVPVEILMIGLGAGSLASWISSRLALAHVTCVELDAAVAATARDYFGLSLGRRCSVRVDDGLAVVKQIAASAASSGSAADPGAASGAPAEAEAESGRVSASAPRPDVIIVDVDAGSGAGSEDMSFPPASFVTLESIETFATAMRPGGLLVLNLACRLDATRDGVLERLRGAFRSVSVLPLQDDVENVIILAQRPYAGLKSAGEEESAASLQVGGAADQSAVPLTSSGRRSLVASLQKLAAGGMGSVDAWEWLAPLQVDPRLAALSRDLEVSEEQKEAGAAADKLAARLAALGSSSGGSGSAGSSSGKKKKRGKKGKK